MILMRVSQIEILIVLAVVLLTFAPYFVKRDIQGIRSKVQLLEHTFVSQKSCVVFLLAANVLFLSLVLYFWIL